MKKRLFFWFLALNVLSIVLIQTSFVPDEYWQSLEIAHHIVFGQFADLNQIYGKITWEWKEGIRSSAYPLFIAVFYKILAFFDLDNVRLLIYTPRLIQAVISAIGYLHTCKIASILYGEGAVLWTAGTLSSSWFLFYCTSRTIHNTIETALIIIALRYYLTNNHFKSTIKYLIFAALSVIIRPTSAIVWLPLSVYYLIEAWKNARHSFEQLIYHYLKTGCLALALQVLLDYIYYRQVLVTPVNFIKFNFLSNQSSHYGTHPWHWYLTQGLPTVLTTHMLPLVCALRNRHHLFLQILCAWIIGVYSISGHKEFRFILPIVPLCACIIGNYLKVLNNGVRNNGTGYWLPTCIIFLLFITNIPLVLYFGMFHQRGTLDAMQYLASEETPDKKMNVLFLMPCHSTPAYSHIHRNVTLRFLSCEPNLKFVANYQDESDIFYANPNKWLSGIDLKLVTHMVLFDSLTSKLSDFLKIHHYLCAKFFHSHFSDGRISKYVVIYCNKNN
uniref:Mannosyltransferase n=1 Tax=Strigamia maritima TaxID=126957 RepID=T1JBD9_STRMM